jgi:hypothetical protein
MNTTTATVITSAIETLQICDRQARKDVDKVIRFSKQVYAVLTSDKAIGYYQIAHEAIGRTIEVFWVIGVTLIDLLDRWIESHESQAAATTEVKTIQSGGRSRSGSHLW